MRQLFFWSYRRIAKFFEPRFFRYLFIGGLSFALQASLYGILSRRIWPNGSRSVENFFAICVTAVFNFLAQRNWTFEAQAGRYVHQMVKYVLGVVSATALQTALFWFGHVYLKMYDFLVIFVVGAVMACYTYSVHRFFTFRTRSSHI